ncbi:MAG: hypothetical protein ACOYD5_07915 [Negativicutes bacterium]
MIDLSKYDAYLIADEAGIAIVDDVPDQVKEELHKINSACFKIYGKNLIRI